MHQRIGFQSSPKNDHRNLGRLRDLVIHDTAALQMLFVGAAAKLSTESARLLPEIGTVNAPRWMCLVRSLAVGTAPRLWPDDSGRRHFPTGSELHWAGAVRSLVVLRAAAGRLLHWIDLSVAIGVAPSGVPQYKLLPGRSSDKNLAGHTGEEHPCRPSAAPWRRLSFAIYATSSLSWEASGSRSSPASSPSSGTAP